MTTRKQYSKEFKLDTISLVLEQGYTQTEAARSLGINANIVELHPPWVNFKCKSTLSDQ